MVGGLDGSRDKEESAKRHWKESVLPDRPINQLYTEWIFDLCTFAKHYDDTASHNLR